MRALIKNKKGNRVRTPISKKRQWIIMKKTLLALAVAAVASTSVQAAEIVKTDEGSVNFYGQLREQFTSTNDDASPSTDLSAGSSRAGVVAKYTAAEGFDVIGHVEFKLTDFSDRLHYIGFATDYGTLKFGQQAIIGDDVYGAEYSYAFGASSGFLYEEFYYLENNIRYELEGDAGWLKAAYNMGERDGGDTVTVDDNGDEDGTPEHAALYAGTAFGDLSVHAGVAHTASGSTATETGSTSYELTGEYSNDGATFGATLFALDGGDDVADRAAISLAAYVPVAAKTAAYGGFQFADVDADDSDETNAYIGLEYKFASWARAYAEYGYSKTDGDDDSVLSTALGARVYW
ncbi:MULTISPECIES: porin [unclassified Vibrio]|uniref:Porin n=1 Tax=Vibrio sp. HB236076 TaxID=3232307 RepID=A0AB39HHM3_9VIBR|nr:porin [Vibrio sp. HB161653]MDP5255081.1 porin [Vibrio sp. HB161653]